jgi:multidrug efflux pump subunit AcrB
MVGGRDGQLAASALVTITDSPGDPELWRENLRPMARSARLERVTEAPSRSAEDAEAMDLPVGYTWEVGGNTTRSARRSRAAADLGHRDDARVRDPRGAVPGVHRLGVILAAAPLSLGGAFGLLLLTGTDLNVRRRWGSSCSWVWSSRRRRAHRLRRDALRGRDVDERRILAARRAAAILMTTLCTLFGLLPLALGLGAGAELQKPLARRSSAVSTSTLITLYLVPAAYLALVGRTTRTRVS